MKYKREHPKFINMRRRTICYRFIFLELLARKINYFYRSLSNYRRKVISEELKIAKVSPKDKVLFIGCGMLPSTPMIIAEEKVAKKITTIDNSRKTAKMAESYISKKGLSDKIKIEYGDGASYPVENFDIIFLAGDVWPLEPILKNLSSNMKKNAKLICREIKDDINLFLKEEELYDKFSFESSSEHPAGSDYKSILLIKK
jgi:predicted RNA methylase